MKYIINYQLGGYYEWPKLNKHIIIHDEIKGNLKGIVYNYIWNNTACVIKLENEDYIEYSLKDKYDYNYGKGYYLLSIYTKWIYNDFGKEVSKKEFKEHVKSEASPKVESEASPKVESEIKPEFKVEVEIKQEIKNENNDLNYDKDINKKCEKK